MSARFHGVYRGHLLTFLLPSDDETQMHIKFYANFSKNLPTDRISALYFQSISTAGTYLPVRASVLFLTDNYLLCYINPYLTEIRKMPVVAVKMQSSEC